jgi:hypothetical protein
MKKEAKLLLEKSVNSLVLCIEHFNRPWDNGLVDTVLILLDHSFEMLMKASILHKGGRIWERGEKQTIGFDKCVRIGLSDASVKFLTNEQALSIQSINQFRDAAQHYLLNFSEQHLYLHVQGGVTVFRDLYRSVFSKDVCVDLPERVLPVSTTPPIDIETLFDKEVSEVRQLLRPGKRHHLEANTKLRSLALFEGAVQGEKVQPSDRQLTKLAERVSKGETWQNLFPGVSAITFSTNGAGHIIELRISKKEGTPIQIVPEGTPGAGVVALKRVSELDFYNLSCREIADKVKLTEPRTRALMRHLGLYDDAEYHKQIPIGKMKYNRFSQKALTSVKESLEKVDWGLVWRTCNDTAWKTSGQQKRMRV